ncbi:MAG: REP-associated tyrosine transposase [Betaproteobacteria bacterium]|jgi:putative transposase
MPRKPRLAVAGHPHHIVQRGNDRQDIFRDDQDRRKYLDWLGELAAQFDVAVHAYVLMPNHVHLLVTPAGAAAMSGLMQALGRRYVRWFNDRHQRTGALWEGRFFSSLIEADRYLLACYRYIEMNPVRAGLVAAPVEYLWSSHRHHVGLKIDPLVSDHSLFWSIGNTPFDRQTAYKALFDQTSDPVELEGIRAAIRQSQALASTGFAAAAKIGQEHLPRTRPVGRPRKAQ